MRYINIYLFIIITPTTQRTDSCNQPTLLPPLRPDWWNYPTLLPPLSYRLVESTNTPTTPLGQTGGINQTLLPPLRPDSWNQPNTPTTPRPDWWNQPTLLPPLAQTGGINQHSYHPSDRLVESTNTPTSQRTDSWNQPTLLPPLV